MRIRYMPEEEVHRDLHVFTDAEIAELIPIAKACKKDSQVIRIEEGLLAGQLVFVVRNGWLIKDYVCKEDGLIFGGQEIYRRTSEVCRMGRARFGIEVCSVEIEIDLGQD